MNIQIFSTNSPERADPHCHFNGIFRIFFKMGTVKKKWFHSFGRLITGVFSIQNVINIFFLKIFSSVISAVQLDYQSLNKRKFQLFLFLLGLHVGCLIILFHFISRLRASRYLNKLTETARPTTTGFLKPAQQVADG